VKLIFLTPGTGSYYCGACLRDNMLARELHRRGHDVSILPMYLPLELDDVTLPNAAQTPIFFGGINVYLQQKIPLFRKTPPVLDRLLNSTGLLRWAARHSHMTSAREHGEMTLEMLNVATSRLQKETDKLFEWLGQSAKPDVICLSTTLLAGFAADLKRRFGCPIITFFQGEDSFLDGLPEPYRTQSWTTMATRLGDSDALLSPSRYYAQFMRERLGAGVGAIEVVPNGVTLDGLGADARANPTAPTSAAATPPAIGYFARMTRDKGLEVFVDAFIHLARDLGDTSTHARIGGAATAGDEPFVAQMKQRLAAAGLEARVTWSPNLSRAEKVSFLRSLTLFSVPAVYREAFGLYLVEAMACGVPVVMPDASAFPEIIHTAGGGVCVAPHDPAALARAWRELLADPPRRAALGAAARKSVENHFSAETMCTRFLEAARRIVPPGPVARSATAT
jgi:glycosyltransferase involved in cell wall biosynthesis